MKEKKLKGGAKHLDIAECMNIFSEIYEAQDALEKALDYAEKGYLILMKYFGKNDKKASDVQKKIELLSERIKNKI